MFKTESYKLSLKLDVVLISKKSSRHWQRHPVKKRRFFKIYYFRHLQEKYFNYARDFSTIKWNYYIFINIIRFISIKKPCASESLKSSFSIKILKFKVIALKCQIILRSFLLFFKNLQRGALFNVSTKMYHVTTDMCWNFANRKWRVCVKNALLFSDFQLMDAA